MKHRHSDMHTNALYCIEGSQTVCVKDLKAYNRLLCRSSDPSRVLRFPVPQLPDTQISPTGRHVVLSSIAMATPSFRVWNFVTVQDEMSPRWTIYLIKYHPKWTCHVVQDTFSPWMAIVNII